MPLPEDFYKFCRRVHGLAAPVEIHCSIVFLELTKYDLPPYQIHFFQEDVFPFITIGCVCRNMCRLSGIPGSLKQNLEKKKVGDSKQWNANCHWFSFCLPPD